jgi:hypothetical protein
VVGLYPAEAFRSIPVVWLSPMGVGLGIGGPGLWRIGEFPFASFSGIVGGDKGFGLRPPPLSLENAARGADGGGTDVGGCHGPCCWARPTPEDTAGGFAGRYAPPFPSHACGAGPSPDGGPLVRPPLMNPPCRPSRSPTLPEGGAPGYGLQGTGVGRMAGAIAGGGLKINRPRVITP